MRPVRDYLRMCRRTIARARTRCGTLARRAVAPLLILHWLLLTLGIPLPAPRVAKDRSTPFPCMDSVCGCHNAEKCWKQCCCHTNEEKIAWARRHGVRPPAYVFAAAAAEERAKQAAQEEPLLAFTLAVKSSAAVERACCEKDVAPLDSCCADAKEATGEDIDLAPMEAYSPPPQRDGSDASVDVISLRLAQNCQGGKQLGIGSWAAVLPPLAIANSADVPLAGEWLELSDQTVRSLSHEPAAPPPRAAI